jgi:hypothetical protein
MLRPRASACAPVYQCTDSIGVGTRPEPTPRCSAFDVEALHRDTLERLGRLGTSPVAREHVTVFVIVSAETSAIASSSTRSPHSCTGASTRRAPRLPRCGARVPVPPPLVFTRSNAKRTAAWWRLEHQ